MIDETKTFADVHLPCGGGPAEAVFNDGIRQFGSYEDEACRDSDGVGTEIGEAGAVDVVGIRIGSDSGLSYEVGDHLVWEEVDGGCLSVAEDGSVCGSGEGGPAMESAENGSEGTEGRLRAVEATKGAHREVARATFVEAETDTHVGCSGCACPWEEGHVGGQEGEVVDCKGQGKTCMLVSKCGRGDSAEGVIGIGGVALAVLTTPRARMEAETDCVEGAGNGRGRATGGGVGLEGEEDGDSER